VSATDFTEAGGMCADRQGHGTHVAGIIAAKHNGSGINGIAPEAEVHCLKVIGDDGQVTGPRLAAAITWCIKNDIHIINMSIGSRSPDSSLESALNAASRAGIIIICSAGNDGHDGVDYPAKYPMTIAVASTDSAGNIAKDSAVGDEVDLAAPGVAILSTYPGNRYAYSSGTSMAAPYVTGIAALILSKHRYKGGSTPINNPEHMRQHLIAHAKDRGSLGRDRYFGYGLVDPRLIFEEIDDSPNIFQRMARSVKGLVSKLFGWSK
jgi:subtilisin family serine protease